MTPASQECLKNNTVHFRVQISVQFMARLEKAYIQPLENYCTHRDCKVHLEGGEYFHFVLSVSTVPGDCALLFVGHRFDVGELEEALVEIVQMQDADQQEGGGNEDPREQSRNRELLQTQIFQPAQKRSSPITPQHLSHCKRIRSVVSNAYFSLLMPVMLDHTLMEDSNWKV